MRTHTSQFKNEIKEYGRQFNDNIYYNNTTYNGDHIFSVNYNVDTTLCKSIMQTLKIDTDISLNVDDTLDYGISVEGATDEIRFNNFIVNKIEEQKDKKSNLVTCYDNMIKAMKDYETPKVNGTAITYPITVRDYLSAICNHLGLTFKNASDTFTNYDKNVTSEHYVDTDGNSLGYTFRDVLDDLAEVVGGFICIDNNGQLEIRNISNTIGKNIFNSTSVVQGYIDSSTSKVTYNSGYRVSTFKVEPNTTYTISKRKNSYNYIGTRQTSASGTLSNVTNMQDYTTSRVKATITTGANDNYLFIDLGPINNYYTIRDSIQVEIGTEVTNFEPYGIDSINEEYFKDKNVNVGKKIGPYNVVVLSRINEDNLYYPTTLPSNPIEFKITDNAILDQDNREDFIQGIYNKINGLEFYLNDFATNGILYYEIGDKYNVSIDSVTYPCLMLSDDIKRTTGLKENIRTNEPKQSVTEFKYASSSDKVEITSRNAKILVDKANASINQIVSAVGDNGQVTSASIIQSINDDTSQIKLEADKINLNGAVTANNNFIINQDGSVEVNSGYITLTDNPSDTEDRFIIWASDKTRLTTLTSEYVLTRTYDENNPNSIYFGYAQLFDTGRVSWGDGVDSNNYTSGSCDEDRITLRKTENGVDTRSQYRSDGATINGRETINTTGNNYAGLEINNSPSRSESAISYKNGNKEYVAGYGVDTFDGWGIYSFETGQNVFTIDKNGNTNINKYSTSEMRVGTWVDGRPIYRKVYQSYTFIPDTNWNYLLLDTSNIIVPINSYGVIFVDGWGNGITIPTQDFGLGAFSKVYKNYSNGNIYVNTTMPQNRIGEVDVVIEYIKTTD